MEQLLVSEGFRVGLRSSSPAFVLFLFFLLLLLLGSWNAVLDLLNYIVYSSDVLTIGEHLKEFLQSIKVEKLTFLYF